MNGFHNNTTIQTIREWKVIPNGQTTSREALYCWRHWLPAAHQHFLECQSLGQSDKCSTNASICDWMGPDRMANQWRLSVVLSLQALETFLDDVIYWDAPFHLRKVELHNCWYHWLSWRWRQHRKWGHCAKLSIMNEVENAESNRALAFIAEPSALTIWTRYIQSITGWRPYSRDWCVW